MSEASEEKPTCPECGEKHVAFTLFAGQDALWDCGSVRWDKLHKFKFAQSYECRGRVIASLHSAVAALTAKLEAVSKERDEANETIECYEAMKEGVEVRISDVADQLAAANKEVERLKRELGDLQATVAIQVRTAMSILNADEGDYHAAMTILGRLCGHVVPELPLESVSIQEVLRRSALLAQSEAKEGSDGK